MRTIDKPNLTPDSETLAILLAEYVLKPGPVYEIRLYFLAWLRWIYAKGDGPALIELLKLLTTFRRIINEKLQPMQKPGASRNDKGK